MLSASLNKTFPSFLPSFVALGVVARVNQVISSILPDYINHGWVSGVMGNGWVDGEIWNDRLVEGWEMCRIV